VTNLREQQTCIRAGKPGADNSNPHADYTTVVSGQWPVVSNWPPTTAHWPLTTDHCSILAMKESVGKATFAFEVLQKDSATAARLGLLHTSHGDVQTPV